MNKTTVEKIEEYLNGELTSEEQSAFESELATDEKLKSILNLYKSIEAEMRTKERHSTNEEALKRSLKPLNDIYFKKESAHQQLKQGAATVVHIKKNNLYRWMAYAVAASIIVVIAILFLNNSSPRQLANNYVSENLTTLSHTMGSADDTLQAGITAYNNKHYDSALQLFQGFYNDHPENSYAKKYIGFTYLIMKDYDSALKQFNELANMEALFSNPGIFLKAVTLMQRNKEGDKEEAKQLLQQVVEQKLEGNKEAEEWLKDW